MKGYNDAWKRAELHPHALDEKLALADLWSRIEAKFGLAPDAAMKIRREPIESGDVALTVPGWRDPADSKQRDEMSHWVEIYNVARDPAYAMALSEYDGPPDFDVDFTPQVTPAGLKQIDFGSGTLAGFEVLVDGWVFERVLSEAGVKPISESNSKPPAEDQGSLDGFFFGFQHARRGNAARDDAFKVINKARGLGYPVMEAAYALVPADTRNPDPKKRGKLDASAVNWPARLEEMGRLPSYRRAYVHGAVVGFQHGRLSGTKYDDLIIFIHNRTGWPLPEIEAVGGAALAVARSSGTGNRGKATSAG